MNAHILNIGNELLLGDIVNTNAAWMARLLLEHSVQVTRVTVVGDDHHEITRAVDRGLKEADLVLITGGLGPTHDDITKTTLMEFFGVGMKREEATLKFIRKMFESRGISVSASNMYQADILENAEVMFNNEGTAPGMWIEYKKKLLAVMPGVPREMKYLMTHEVIPRLKLKNGDASGYYSRYFQLTGIGESNLSDDVIGPLDRFLKKGITLAYLPHIHGITLRISSYAATQDKAHKQAMNLEDHILSTAGEYIFSDQPEDPLEHALIRMLTKYGKTLSTAESCTGGWVSNLLTNVPGSSAVFLGGMVSYSNDLKTGWLDVPPDMLKNHGAVSKPVALTMARNIALQTGSDIGISTTGIAGPGGGSSEKPVGTVWIGYWSKDAHFAVHARFFRDRLVNKERSAVVAMDIVRRQLQGIGALPYALMAEPA